MIHIRKRRLNATSGGFGYDYKKITRLIREGMYDVAVVSLESPAKSLSVFRSSANAAESGVTFAASGILYKSFIILIFALSPFNFTIHTVYL